MNEIRALYAKGSGIAKGANIASCCEPVSKCMAESYSTSKKKKRFWRKITAFFDTVLSEIDLGNVDTWQM